MAATATIRIMGDVAAVTKALQMVGIEMDQLKGKLTSFNAAARTSAATWGDATRQIMAGVRQIGQGLQTLGLMATAAAIPIGLVFKEGISQAADFQSTMDSIHAVLRTTGVEGANLEANFTKAFGAILEAGRKSIFGPQALAEAVLDLVKAGQDLDSALRTTIASSNLAAATFDGAERSVANFAETNKTLNQIMKAYQIPASEAARYTDLFATVVNRSAVDMGDFWEAMKRGFPYARTAGIAVDELAIAIGLVADRGVEGSRAGREFGSGLVQMFSSTTRASAALKELGVSLTDSTGNIKPLRGLIGELNQALFQTPKAMKATTGASAQLVRDLQQAEAVFNRTNDVLIKNRLVLAANAQGQVGYNEVMQLLSAKTLPEFNVAHVRLAAVWDKMSPKLRTMVTGYESSFIAQDKAKESLEKLVTQYNQALAPQDKLALVGGKVAEAQRLQYASSILGRVGMQAWLPLIEAGIEGFDAYAENLKNATSAQDLAAEKTDNLKGKFQLLQSALSSLYIEVGIPLIEKFLTPLVEKLTEAVDWFRKLPKPVKNVAIALAAIFAVGAPLLLALGMLGFALGIIGTGIVTLLQGLAMATTLFAPFIPLILLAGVALAALAGIMALVSAAIISRWPAIQKSITDFWNAIQPALQAWRQRLEYLALTVLPLLGKAWNAIADGIAKAIDVVLAHLTMLFVASGQEGPATDVWRNFAEVIRQAAAKVAEFGVWLGQRLPIWADTAMKAIRKFLGALGELVSGRIDLKGFIEKLFGADIAGKAQGFGDILKTVGDTIKATFEWLQRNGPALAGIIAGIVAGFLAAGPILSPAFQGLLAVLPIVATLLSEMAAWIGSVVTGGAGFVGFMASLQGALLGATGTVGTFLATAAPIVGLFLLIASTVAGGVKLIIDNFDTIKARALPILENLKKGVEGFISGFVRGINSALVQFGGLQGLWDRLVAAGRPLIETLMQIGAVIAGVLMVALGGLINAVGNMLPILGEALGNFLGALAALFTGLVGILSGIVETVKGVLTFIVGFFLQRGDLMEEGVRQMAEGVTNIWNGLKDAIGGIVIGLVSLVLGTIGALVAGIIGFFQGLWIALVGGSLIPDLVNSIITWLTITLPQMVLLGLAIFISQFLSQIGQFTIDLLARWAALVTDAQTKFEELKTAVITKVTELVTDFLAKITEFAGNLWTALQDIKNNKFLRWIGEIAGGLLAGAREAGENVIRGIVQGIENLWHNLLGIIERIRSLLTFNIGINLPSFTGGGQPPPNFGGTKQSGGPVRAGIAYLIGERGPELLMPNLSGMILPNRFLDSLIAPSGKGGNTYNLTYHANVREAWGEQDAQRVFELMELAATMTPA